MSMIESDGTERELNAQDYTPSGELKTVSADLALVLGSTRRAETFIQNKQYQLLWRDSDLLFQSPRPMTTYENTYILEPNVQRFTVAKVCNAVVPQLYKGLFYTDPPMVLRPRPGTPQAVIDAKTALFSVLLDECKFKTETKWGLEQMAHLGTGIWKWGIDYKKVVKFKRRAATTNVGIDVGDVEAPQIVPQDVAPQVTREEKIVARPFIENRSLDKVLVDPKCTVGDIREAKFVVDVRYMDFYDLHIIFEAIQNNPDDPNVKGWNLPKTEQELQQWWLPPTDANQPPTLASTQATFTQAIVHHSEEVNINVSPDLLQKKLEVLEYWDANRKVVVIDRRKVIFSGDNPFGVVPFLSANWWNRPRAFYGMGLGLIVGQNQRVDQGTINAILKILAFGVNPVYLRKRDSNTPTQMIRTGLGKILTVDTEVDKSYKLLETPKVPGEVWAALQESEKATESTSGADQMLVQGSTAGPRTSMGRTAGGASILSSASATRLDGPLDNFIEQVFKPFLYILDMLVLNYISDKEIFDILGDEMGREFEVDLQKFHDANIEYEVLAGASLSAKRTMAQSITLITQIFNNPNLQEQLAEINGEYIDFKPILRMWMEASEWKNVNDIIKPLTPEMQQRMAQKSAAAQAASKLNQQMQLNNQKFQQKQQMEDQQNDGRIKRDMIREAFRDNGLSEATEGVPSFGGLEGTEPTIA